MHVETGSGCRKMSELTVASHVRMVHLVIRRFLDMIFRFAESHERMLGVGLIDSIEAV